MSRLWILTVTLTLALSCATTRPEDEAPVAAGDPCPQPRYIEFLDGSRLQEIEGRLIARDEAGTLHPIGSARILYWDVRDDPDAHPPEILIDRDGRFKTTVGLPWSKQLFCREGRVASKQTVGTGKLVIRARGCEETLITVGPDWVTQDIELRCSSSRGSG